MSAVKRIFCRNKTVPYTGKNRALALYKRVGVPYPLAATPHIINNRTRHPALRIIIVSLESPVAAWHRSKKIHFETRSVYVAVLPHSRGVISKFTRRIHPPVAKLILARRIKPLGA